MEKSDKNKPEITANDQQKAIQAAQNILTSDDKDLRSI